MRRFLSTLSILALLLALTSCQSAVVLQEPMAVEAALPDGQDPQTGTDPVPETIPVPEAETVEPDVPVEAEPQTETGPEAPSQIAYTVGETGPNGGLVFECNGIHLEMGEPIYEVSNFDESVALIAKLSEESGVLYRLPSIVELECIYEQLVLTGLDEDIEWTYYWSCEEIDETSAKVLNFDTGFEGQFYKSMDFLGVIPVVEL